MISASLRTLYIIHTYIYIYSMSFSAFAFVKDLGMFPTCCDSIFRICSPQPYVWIYAHCLQPFHFFHFFPDAISVPMKTHLKSKYSLGYQSCDRHRTTTLHCVINPVISTPVWYILLLIITNNI